MGQALYFGREAGRIGDMMTCNHPEGCMAFDEEKNSFCEWCAEVEALRRENAMLLDAIKEKAVVIHGGNVRIDGPIGCLWVYGGTVGTASNEPSTVSNCQPKS